MTAGQYQKKRESAHLHTHGSWPHCAVLAIAGLLQGILLKHIMASTTLPRPPPAPASAPADRQALKPTGYSLKQLPAGVRRGRQGYRCFSSSLAGEHQLPAARNLSANFCLHSNRWMEAWGPWGDMITWLSPRTDDTLAQRPCALLLNLSKGDRRLCW